MSVNKFAELLCIPQVAAPAWGLFTGKKQNLKRVVAAELARQAELARRQKAKPPVISGIAQNHDPRRRPALTFVEPCPDERGANAATLKFGQNRQGRKSQPRGNGLVSFTGDRAEQNVSDYAAFQLGCQGDDPHSSADQQPHQAGFEIAQKRLPMNGLNSRQIGDCGGTDFHFEFLVDFFLTLLLAN